MVVLSLCISFVVMVVVAVKAINKLRKMREMYEDSIAQNGRLSNILRLKGIEIDKLERENDKLKKG
jgi:hypothetical protein